MLQEPVNEDLPESIQNQPVRFKLDNVSPISLFDKLSLHKTLIRSTNVNLSTLTGEKYQLKALLILIVL